MVRLIAILVAIDSSLLRVFDHKNSVKGEFGGSDPDLECERIPTSRKSELLSSGYIGLKSFEDTLRRTDF